MEYPTFVVTNWVNKREPLTVLFNVLTQRTNESISVFESIEHEVKRVKWVPFMFVVTVQEPKKPP